MRFHFLDTTGYSTAELDEINRMFEVAIQDAHLDEDATDLEVGAIMDAVAERVLAEFDARKAAQPED